MLCSSPVSLPVKMLSGSVPFESVSDRQLFFLDGTLRRKVLPENGSNAFSCTTFLYKEVSDKTMVMINVEPETTPPAG